MSTAARYRLGLVSEQNAVQIDYISFWDNSHNIQLHINLFILGFDKSGLC